MRFEEFGDDLVLANEFGFELFDLLVLGWSAGPHYCLSKCADITGAQYFLKTERVNRRYTSVVLDWNTRLPIASAA